MKLLHLVTGLVGVIITTSTMGKDFPSPITQGETLQYLLENISSTPPVPFESLPKKQQYIAFWSFQNPQWPPMPGNFYDLPVWNLGDSVLIDDRKFNYVELSAAVETSSLLAPMAMAANSTATYAYANPVFITNLSPMINESSVVTESFDIAGGTNLVPYDILMTTNVPATNCNWLGIGYTAKHYSFSSQPTDQAFYLLSRPTKTMIVGIGNNSASQCNTPNSTNIVQVAAGGSHSLALKADGTVIAWGANGYNQCIVPSDLSGVAQVGAGWYHSVALLSNGTVRAWGENNPTIHWNFTTVPPSLTNAVAISVQAMHSLGLKKDGTVVAWGYDSGSGETNVPSSLSNVIAISAGYEHNLAVKSDGTVVAWGNNGHGQCDVPPTLNNVVDVAAGTFHSLALKGDGTIVAWGNNTAGETTVPSGLNNVVAIAASGDPFYGSLAQFVGE